MRRWPRRVWAFVTETFVEWSKDRGASAGAALAYYTIVALAPGLVIVVALAGVALGPGEAKSHVVQQVRYVAGDRVAEAVSATIEAARGSGAGVSAGALAIVALVFGLWGVFGELQDTLNRMWGAARPPAPTLLEAVKRRVWSFATVVGVGFLLLASLAVSAWLAVLARFFRHLLPLPPAVLAAFDWLVSFVGVTALFAVMFRLLPDVTLRWRDVWIGAALTSLLFVGGKFVIGFYLGQAAVTSPYGAAGSLLVILIWLYYSAQILYLGAEATKVWTRRRRSTIAPYSGHRRQAA
jgi:membrane protein